MKPVLLATLLPALVGALLATASARSGAADLSDRDAYDNLRQGCTVAGDDSWNRCRLVAAPATDPGRQYCNEARERERRLCMLHVMERQNRDIQGTGITALE